MESRTPEYRAAYWKTYRAKSLPYAARKCSLCGEAFHPKGPQRRCSACMVSKCPTCGCAVHAKDGRKRKYCSRRCNAKDHVSTLIAKRGRKPRTYYVRNRDKHGSAEERDWRSAVFARDSWTCQECGSRGGRLNADHIKPWSTHPDIRFDVSNGRTLCVPCHKKTPTYGWRGYWLKRRAGEIAAKRLAQEVLFPAEPRR